MLQSPLFATEPEPSTTSLARSNSYYNLLSKATTTKMFRGPCPRTTTTGPTRRLQIRPHRQHPKPSHFFPSPEPETSQFGAEQTVGDVSRATVTISHRPKAIDSPIQWEASRESLFLTAPDTSSISLASVAAVTIPPSTATPGLVCHFSFGFQSQLSSRPYSAHRVSI